MSATPTPGLTSIPEPETLAMLGLVDAFRRIHETMHNRNFCFILGAGASKSSGIKLASEMVGEWLDVLYRAATGIAKTCPHDWPSDATLQVTGFSRNDPAGSYSALYRRMYQDDPDSGYAYLEEQMKTAEPSFGYSVLGRIMAATRHRVVVTVNFDNLVADSLSLFSATYPLVCGHESLAQFATDNLRRPLVLKVHRDLLMNPMSTPEEMQLLDRGFAEAIGRLLKNYTPIVIGYGGNDGSLMKCLEDLPDKSIPGGVYWCYREGSEPPPRRIRDFVSKQRGKLVPILGFDELLMQFGNVLGYGVPDQYVLDRAKTRAERIVKQVQELQKRIQQRDEAAMKLAAMPLSPCGSTDIRVVSKAMSDTMQRKEGEKRWWQWQQEADSEPDIQKQETIYRDAVAALPDSAPLIGNYAVFLHEIRKDYDAAEALYKRAIDADPKDANNLGNYGFFLTHIRKDHDAAEAMFKRAIEADPKYAQGLVGYAVFLNDIRKDYDGAEALYKRAIDADPKDANNLGNYGFFLTHIRKDHDAAEAMFKRAIEADPKYVRGLAGYAVFLNNIRKDYDAAEAMFKRAIEADPDEVDPTHTSNIANYASYLLSAGRVEEGLSTLDAAFKSMTGDDPQPVTAECWMYAYCCRPPAPHPEALKQLKSLIIDHGIRTDEWSFSEVIAQAAKLKHPEIDWLPKLAEVLAGRATPATLDPWEAWRKV